MFIIARSVDFYLKTVRPTLVELPVGSGSFWNLPELTTIFRLVHSSTTGYHLLVESVTLQRYLLGSGY